MGFICLSVKKDIVPNMKPIMMKMEPNIARAFAMTTTTMITPPALRNAVETQDLESNNGMPNL